MNCDYSKEPADVSPTVNNSESGFLPSERIFCKYCKEFLGFRNESKTQETSRAVCVSCLGFSCDCGHLGLQHNSISESCFFYDPIKSRSCKCNQFKNKFLNQE